MNPQQSPYMRPPMPPQQSNLPPQEVRKQKRQYPNMPQDYSQQYPPQQQFQPVSPFQRQASPQQPITHYQQPIQQPIQPYQQPIQPYQQTQPYQQPQVYQQPQTYQQQPAYQQPASPYQQTLNGLNNLNINQPIRHDVLLTGQPALIEDLSVELTNPTIPQNATATGSPFAQVSPCFNYSTVNAFPYNNALLKKSKLPLAIILEPYLSLKNEKVEVPVVPDTVVTRCSRCKTYINPFVQFTAGALQWKCNMCGMDNEVPQEFDWDITTQQATDRYGRAELNHGCVDFVAPAEYAIRPPQPPVYVFVIDISFQAVQSGMIGVVADSIQSSLDQLPNEDGRTKVAFIMVDSAVGFVKLMGSDPEILVVGDLDDIYLPRASSDLVVNLVESRKTVEDLLVKMKTMYTNTHNPSNCLGSALQAARKLLAPTGGKIVCFQASLPTLGPGAITPKADANTKPILSSPLMTASNGFYESFASDCVKTQVCADMFIFGSVNQTSDVCTLNIIPRFTGGQTHFYPEFSTHPAACIRLKEEVKSLLSEQIGLEAVIRTRCSPGIVCHAFYGNFTTRVPDIMALPNVPRDQSYTVEVVIEEEIQSNFVYFQTAMLYTTCFGERRIRVMNLCLPVTKHLSELYNSANQLAIARTLCHQAINEGTIRKLSNGRDHLAQQTAAIFHGYIHEIATNKTQLSICRPLALLPLLILGILKSDAFQDVPVPQDVRSQSAILLRTLPTLSWLKYVHPQFYSIHNMPASAGAIDQATSKIGLPPVAHLSSEKLEAYGCFLLDNGQAIYLWVGKQAVPQLCKDLFGVSSIQELKSTQIPLLPEIKSPISDRLINIVKSIQNDRLVTYYPTIHIVKEDGDPMLRSRFLSHLIEDRLPTGPTTAGANQQNVSSGMSYYQWLGYIKSKSQ